MSVSTTAKYLTSGQVARLLVVSKGTVLRAVRTGTLHAAYRMPGGGLRFLPADVDRYRQSLQLAPQLPAVASTAAGPLPVPASAALVAGAATADAGTFPPAASVDLPSPAVIAGTSGRPAEIVSSVLTLLAKGVRVGATCVARRIQGHWQIDQLYDRAGMGLRVVTAPPYSSVYGQALAEGRLPSLLVEDLRAVHRAIPTFFAARVIYLLRNLSRGHGVGFFEAGNFHPDFILWLLTDDRQDICFVDPKGIRNLGSKDPKVKFYKTVKEIEARIGDPNVALHSYIVSNTPSHEVQALWSMSKQAMREKHILFQEEDSGTYIGSMLRGIVGA